MTIVGAALGFVAGAVLALLVNVDLLGFAKSGGSAAPGEREQVMRWTMRAVLVIAPVVGAWIGFTQAEEIFGSLS